MNENKIAEKITVNESRIVELEDVCSKLRAKMAGFKANHVPAHLELELKKHMAEIDELKRINADWDQKRSALRSQHEEDERVKQKKRDIHKHLKQIQPFIECDSPIKILYGIYLLETFYHNEGKEFPDEMKKVILFTKNKVDNQDTNTAIKERFQIFMRNIHRPASARRNNNIDIDILNYLQKRINHYYLKAIQELLQSNYREALKLIYPINKEDPGYADSTNIIAVINIHYDIQNVYLRGIKEVERKSYAEAIRSFTEVIDIDPDYKDAQSRLNDAQEKDKQKEINKAKNDEEARLRARRDEEKFLYIYAAIVAIFSLAGYLFLRNIKFHLAAPSTLLLSTSLGQWAGIGISFLIQSWRSNSPAGARFYGTYIVIVTAAIILINIIAPSSSNLIILCLPILIAFLLFKNIDTLVRSRKRSKHPFDIFGEYEDETNPNQRDLKNNQDKYIAPTNICIFFVMTCGLAYLAGKDYSLLFANRARIWPGEWGYITTLIVNGIITLSLFGMPLFCLFRQYHHSAIPLHGIAISTLLILIILQIILPTYPRNAIALNWLTIIGGATYANYLQNHKEIFTHQPSLTR